MVFFPKGLESMILVKNCQFLHFFIAGLISQENVFHDTLERKNAFLGYKNKKFKKSKNGSFSKGANPWFWSKSISFSILLFRPKKCQEKVFYHILQRKNVFLRFKIIANWWANKSSKIHSQKHWSQRSLESKVVCGLLLRSPKGRPHRSCANRARLLAALARD